MRYDKAIHFVEPSDGDYYDTELGEWLENEPKITETIANVTDLGTNRSVEIFGDIKQGAKVIRTQPLFDVPKNWQYIKIDGKTYNLTTERQPHNRNSLIVQEVIVDGES